MHTRLSKRTPVNFGGLPLVGFTDEERKGEWEWVTGEAVTFTNRNPGDPNNALGREHWAAIWPGLQYGWVDTGGHLSFVVEWDD